jgi:ATP phosphoribosyltransferase
LETSIKIALPKGRLLARTANLLGESGWGLSDYSERTRLYNISSSHFPHLTGKMFQEKDIPIQVAMGNYDLGICGLDWIEELLVKYPSSQLIKVRDLGFGDTNLFIATSNLSMELTISHYQETNKIVSIASEYPNLAESFALKRRIKRFNIFPVWGASEIYPPENSDLVLLSIKTGHELASWNICPLEKILASRAYIIANKNSWENKDLSQFLDLIYTDSDDLKPNFGGFECNKVTPREIHPGVFPDNKVRLALPDGHAQKHVVNILNKAGIVINGYPAEDGNRKPYLNMPEMVAKVIRPQDMPLQVANSKFDLAITGQDWVKEHLYKFPSSPIIQLVDLRYSRVKIVVALHNSVPINDVAGLRQVVTSREWKLRIASEYVSIADKFARDNRLGMYQIIPTWGATEAFIPDDADLLIENTETGSTLKRHNLKIIEILFESTACLVANKGSLGSSKASIINSFADVLKNAVEDN